MSLYKKRLLLFLDYCREMYRYDQSSEPFDEKQAKDVAVSYMYEKGFEWIDIWDGKQLIGLLIIGIDLPHVHGEGLYICDAYIVPGYRRQEQMSRAVLPILAIQEGPVYMEIYKKNKAAKKFWARLMEETGFTLAEEKKDRSGIPGLVERRYQKEGKKG